MPNRLSAAIWIVLAVGATIAALLAVPAEEAPGTLIVRVAIVVLVTVLGLLPSTRPIIARPLQWLRQNPALFWLLILAYLIVVPGWWVAKFQPTYGRPPTAVEIAYGLMVLWGFWLLVTYGINEQELREMGRKLGKSPFSGVLVTLTTLVIVLIGAETYMRLFYITTDGYGFTAMNYHWYNNFYWGHENSLGFRDEEPDEAAQMRVAVVGDSFAVGHGINDIDRAFPQMLEAQLGPDYDVNLVARSGLDMNIYRSLLENYPLSPDVVILSYYLNDIDYLLSDPEANPDARNFDFPENETVAWVVLNYFVPNYLYYNLLQFTSPARTEGHATDLVDAHLQDEFWEPHAEQLDDFVTWVQDRDKQLIVLLWPHIANIEDSQPAVAKLTAFFADHDVTVVDMSDVLRGRNTRQLIVNRFDTHPSAEAHRLAAEALYLAITEDAP